MKKDLLTKPFPLELVKQRQGPGGKTFRYVETHAVITRLNDACETWSFEILKHAVRSDEVIVVGRLTADGVVKSSFGGSAITRDKEDRPVSIADDLKAAASDALKKAASLLGVGLELYGAGQKNAEEPPRSSPRQAPKPVMPSISDRLTTRQFAAIQSAARRRNIARDLLGGMLEERFKKNELAQLTRREASSFIAELSESNGTHA